MSNGIAAAMNASGQFEVSVITLRGTTKRVKVVSKFLVQPERLGLWFNTEYTDQEVLVHDDTEKWLAQIAGAKQVTKWEFHT